MTQLTDRIAAILRLQQEWTADWHRSTPTPPAPDLEGLATTNHHHNFSLWHAEDQARRTDVDATVIRDAKRTIDHHNQLRNDAIERIDQFLIESIRLNPDAPLHTETPGMILDRMSILALKEYHMEEESVRPDADSAHRERCAQKLAVIRSQRTDLGTALLDLLTACNSGHRRFKVYFQFKMYNDPALNPALRK